MPRPDSTPPVPPDGWQRVTLDVRLGSEPVSGVIHHRGRQTAFTGWLALASALERAFGNKEMPTQ